MSSATVSRSVTTRIKARRDAWKAKIRDDVNLGVPCLLHLLEPEIVFEHAKVLSQAASLMLPVEDSALQMPSSSGLITPNTY